MSWRFGQLKNSRRNAAHGLAYFNKFLGIGVRWSNQLPWLDTQAGPWQLLGPFAGIQLLHSSQFFAPLSRLTEGDERFAQPMVRGDLVRQEPDSLTKIPQRITRPS